MANETWKFVQAKSKQAMKQVLGIRDEAARMTVTPPLAVAPLARGTPCARGRHAMEPERRRRQLQPLRAILARASP